MGWSIRSSPQCNLTWRKIRIKAKLPPTVTSMLQWKTSSSNIIQHFSLGLDAKPKLRKNLKRVKHFLKLIKRQLKLAVAIIANWISLGMKSQRLLRFQWLESTGWYKCNRHLTCDQCFGMRVTFNGRKFKGIYIECNQWHRQWYLRYLENLARFWIWLLLF